jgi:hypothetical protein
MGSFGCPLFYSEVDIKLKYVILILGTDERNTMLDFLPQYVAMQMSTKDTSSKLKNWQPNPDLTEKELDEMRKDVLDRIIIARVGLLLRHPFFGNMATRLRIQCADEWCPTAAVDGRNLYFNTQFFNAMNNKEIEFVIAHEILHCVFDHLGRRD